MRKLVVSEFVSLDGVMQDPQNWSLEFESQEKDDFKVKELGDADTLLLGRVTYVGFAAAWPSMSHEAGEYADWMNGYPKHVVSTTLQTADWNNSSIIKENVVEEIKKLKNQEGKDILVFGSGSLVDTLAQNDLVDEYRLMIFPVVVGTGKRLFQGVGGTKTLSLVEAKSLGGGVTLLTYAPKRDA